jgi:hypothetical protein
MPQSPLKNRPLSSMAALLVAAALVLGGLMLARAGRAAVGPQIPTAPALPLLPDPNAPAPAMTPQTAAVQALDATHFVVVTREPRLVSKAGEEGRYYNMVLNVVTYYTVQNGRLIPLEHVHVPQGWRALAVGD